MQKIFNIHTHTYPPAIAEKAVSSLGKFYNFVPEGDGTLADLERDAKEYGASGMLLLATATNPHQVEKVNDGIAAMVNSSRERGFIAYGFAGIHQDCTDLEKEIDRCEKMGLCGVKIHPDIQGVDIDDTRLLRLYEIIEGRMPLCLHMGDDRPEYRFSEADKLLKIKKLFPKLEVLAAHLGGYKSWEAAERLIGIEGIHFDTSSALWAMTPEMGTEIVHKLGIENVMFGTDYPVKLLATELLRFDALDLTAAEREAILYNNAAKFLGFEA